MSRSTRKRGPVVAKLYERAFAQVDEVRAKLEALRSRASLVTGSSVVPSCAASDAAPVPSDEAPTVECLLPRRHTIDEFRAALANLRAVL